MTTATLTHTCPKCAGVGTVPHRHIHDGVCFLCNGAKAVTERAAASWLAGQVGPLPRTQAASNRPRVVRPSKTVPLGEFGSVVITKLDDGTFNASRILACNEDYDGESDGGHEYHLFFAVEGGRVIVDRDCIQNGMRDHWRRAEKALQAALKV